METILIDANGLQTEALLLAAGDGRMRVIFRNGNDTIELRREGEQWLSEDGSTFQLEAWFADRCLGWEDHRSKLSPRVERAFGAWLSQVNPISGGGCNLPA
jgi:hypothetical protein